LQQPPKQNNRIPLAMFANGDKKMSRKEYEVDITEISRRGDGIAKVQDFVFFAENEKVGSKVKVKVTLVADRFAKQQLCPKQYKKSPVCL
jgi:predicted RNA-binding protein with TRAM domain